MSRFGILRFHFAFPFFVGVCSTHYCPFRRCCRLLTFICHQNVFACPAVDSLEHCFYSCPFAIEVWRFFERRLGLFLRQNQSWFQQLWFLWANVVYTDLYPLIRFLPIAISWGLWRTRNIIIKDNKSPSLSQAIFWAEEVLQGITEVAPLKLHSQAARSVNLRSIRVIPIRRQVTALSWEKPEVGRLKLNSDGSSLHNPGESGGGFVAASTIYFGFQFVCRDICAAPWY